MADTKTTDEQIGLHNLSPAEGSHRVRKRVGRGPGSGTGKTSGRGQKGQKSRSGSHAMRPGFAGGQMPIAMQQGKLRGPHKKTSMPMGPFRTHTQGVNVRDLARRFEAGAEVTPETLLASGLLRHLRHPVKILGEGELSIALTVTAHGFSASAREKIEAAGGSARLLGDPTPEPAAGEPAKRKRKAPTPKATATEDDAPLADEAPAVDETPAAESESAEQE